MGQTQESSSSRHGCPNVLIRAPCRLRLHRRLNYSRVKRMTLEDLHGNLSRPCSLYERGERLCKGKVSWISLRSFIFKKLLDYVSYSISISGRNPSKWFAKVFITIQDTMDWFQWAQTVDCLHFYMTQYKSFYFPLKISLKSILYRANCCWQRGPALVTGIHYKW